MKTLLFSFVASFGLSVILTPFIIYIARKLGAVDYPRPGHIHERSVPSFGGIAIYVAVTFPIIFGIVRRYILTGNYNAHLLGLVVGGFVVFLVGLADDAFELRWWLKLVLQAAAAVLLVAFGYAVRFHAYEFSFFGFELSSYISIILVVAWLIAGTNASNLVDGLDGLCAGLIAIASGTIAAIALIRTDFLVAELMLALVGACIGFLVFNFYPAKIIMGDTGALFLGFTYAGIAAIVNIKTMAVTAFIVPMIALAVPLTEVVYAVIRRSRKKRRISSRDTDFFYNKLARSRLGVRGTVIYIWLLGLILGATTVVFNFVNRDFRLAILIILGVIFVIFVYLLENIRIERPGGRINGG